MNASKSSKSQVSQEDAFKRTNKVKENIKKRREQARADVAAGGPIERDEAKAPPRPSQRPSPSKRESLEDKLAKQEREELKRHAQSYSNSEELWVYVQNIERNLGQLRRQYEASIMSQSATNGDLYAEHAALDDEVKEIKRTNSLGAVISKIYHAFVGKLKGKPKAQVQEIKPIVKIAPAVKQTAVAVSAPAQVPKVPIATKTEKGGIKYLLETADGLKASVYERGGGAIMEYINPAGQRHLYLLDLTLDKILNTDKTPATPAGAVIELYETWKKSKVSSTSLK